MTMMLMAAMEAEVEPVAGKEGWFKLTGKNIMRSDYAGAYEFIDDATQSGLKVHKDARIEEMHSEYPDVLEDDPRFNYEADDNFAVIEGKDGRFTMILDVNWPEYTLFQHITEHREDVGRD